MPSRQSFSFAQISKQKMSSFSSRLGALRRLAAPSRPSLTGGGNSGGGGGGRASNSPRRVGEDDNENGIRRQKSRLQGVVVKSAMFVAAPLAASRPARAGPARPRASSTPSSEAEGRLKK